MYKEFLKQKKQKQKSKQCNLTIVKRFEQTLFRRYKYGQRAHELVIHIISHQENAS